ncbi:glycine-rich protein 23-like [Mercurialis annua]|uniref:glycine-rich protein 23-like n=1 Tax=Mercurialis annua TaxID=3986 RepID=UPI00215E8915|nr:glycine-rich protein 23-like [Mercurialis annua]
MGIREALSWLKDVLAVVVESDALEVILDICNPSRAKSNSLITDYVERSVNQIAHVLARYARSLSSHQECRIWQSVGHGGGDGGANGFQGGSKHEIIDIGKLENGGGIDGGGPVEFSSGIVDEPKNFSGGGNGGGGGGAGCDSDGGAECDSGRDGGGGGGGSDGGCSSTTQGGGGC